MLCVHALRIISLKATLLKREIFYDHNQKGTFTVNTVQIRINNSGTLFNAVAMRSSLQQVQEFQPLEDREGVVFRVSNSLKLRSELSLLIRYSCHYLGLTLSEVDLQVN